MTDEKLSQAWQTLIEQDGLMVGRDGSVRFTSKRRADLTGWFALAGIDIRNVRTQAQYLAAREQAQPYFQQWLEHVASRGEMTRERQLLRAIVRDDQAEIERLKAELAVEKVSTGRD